MFKPSSFLSNEIGSSSTDGRSISLSLTKQIEARSSSVPAVTSTTIRTNRLAFPEVTGARSRLLTECLEKAKSPPKANLDEAPVDLSQVADDHGSEIPIRSNKGIAVESKRADASEGYRCCVNGEDRIVAAAKVKAKAFPVRINSGPDRRTRSDERLTQPFQSSPG